MAKRIYNTINGKNGSSITELTVFKVGCPIISNYGQQIYSLLKSEPWGNMRKQKAEGMNVVKECTPIPENVYSVEE